MKKLLLILFVFSSVFCFSQGAEKKAIDWIPLAKAEKFAKKYDKNIFILFYRPGCEYCEKMKKTTLSDPAVIKLINENFPFDICFVFDSARFYLNYSYSGRRNYSINRFIDWTFF